MSSIALNTSIVVEFIMHVNSFCFCDALVQSYFSKIKYHIPKKEIINLNKIILIFLHVLFKLLRSNFFCDNQQRHHVATF